VKAARRRLDALRHRGTPWSARCAAGASTASRPTGTYEDPSITDPHERERAFLQHDHVRLYTPDIAGRLEAAGFAVQTIDTYAELGTAAARHRLQPADLAFLCRA